MSINAAKNMDDVFAQANEQELEFDVIFDQDDSLIDTVLGVNEAGDPLTGADFETLHNDQEDATAKDVRDVESDDELCGAKDPEGTDGYDIINMAAGKYLDKETEADKYYHTKCDGDECNCKVDPEHIYDFKCCKEESEEFDQEADTKKRSGEAEESEDEDELEEACHKEEDDIDDELLDDSDELEEACHKEEDDIDDELSDSNKEEVENESSLFEADGIDNDVEDVADSVDDDDEDAIEKTDDSAKLSYDISDEDLINIALNGDED